LFTVDVATPYEYTQSESGMRRGFTIFRRLAVEIMTVKEMETDSNPLAGALSTGTVYVEDALDFLDTFKTTFANSPQRYQEFLRIMGLYKQEK
jgi:hypothetical protein